MSIIDTLFDEWTRLSCRSFAANAVRLQLHALAYNLGNFLRTLATPEPIRDWSLTSPKEKLIKIGAKVVSHGCYVAFQMTALAADRGRIAELMRSIYKVEARWCALLLRHIKALGKRGSPKVGVIRDLSGCRAILIDPPRGAMEAAEIEMTADRH